MNSNPMIESYVCDMERLIVLVLGDVSEADIARLSGLDIEKVKQLSTTKEMVKLNHLIKSHKNNSGSTICGFEYFNADPVVLNG